MATCVLTFGESPIKIAEIKPAPTSSPARVPEKGRSMWWLGLIIVAVAGIIFFAFFGGRKRPGLVFITAPQTIEVAGPSNIMTIQIQDAKGRPYGVRNDISIKLSASSPSGRFALQPSGSYDGSVTSVVIPKKADSASFYYRDDITGTPVITAKESPDQDWRSASQQVKVFGKEPA